MDTIMRSCPVKLTEAEKNERGYQMGLQVKAKAAAEREKETANAGFKSRIQTAEAEITLLSQVLVSGEEHREVECDQIPNRVEGTCQIVRRDTGEVVTERPLTDKEMHKLMQMSLDDLEKESRTVTMTANSPEEAKRKYGRGRGKGPDLTTAA
jgi:hypothetical protein